MRIEWRDAVNRAGVYQSTAYGQAAALSTAATWEVLGDSDGRWRMPLCINGAPGDLYDAASPYGYPGIYAAGSLSEEEIADAWSQSRALLAERGVVAVFFRFAPYREEIEQWHHRLSGLRTVRLSDTFLVPTADESVMWDAMQGRARTAIRKAEREGMTASVTEADHSSLFGEGGFRRVYDIAMDRVDAADHHRHSDEYYSRLMAGLGPNLQLVQVRNIEGDVVAASLLLVDRDAVHYHLSGSTRDGARLGANNLMLWTAMRWASQNGHSAVHLGGGTKQGDSLFRFKASFGGLTLPFFAGQLVARPDDYDRLVLARAKELGVSVRDLGSSPYFPAYRGVVAV